MKRVLIISYYFPPDGGVGPQRAMKFAKYLPQFGWDVSVLTRQAEHKNDTHVPEDNSLTEQLGLEKDSIRRVKDNRENVVSGPIDSFETWSLTAADVADEWVRAEHFDVVFITMSPFSQVRIAKRIQETSKVPVVLDFRDPWVFDGWTPERTYFHWRRKFSEMRNAVEAAQGVIANTPESGKVFSENFRIEETSHLQVIPNGFDAEDYEEPLNPAFMAPNDGIVRLLFSGTLASHMVEAYAGPKGIVKRAIGYVAEPIDYSGRTLIHLLKAISLLRERNISLGQRVRIECLGVAKESDRRSVEQSDAPNAVNFLGYLPHSEALLRTRSATALFLPLHGLPKGHRSRIVPAKTYEYLATGRPVLGCLPEGDAQDLVAKSDVSAISDPCDPENIAEALLSLEKIIETTPKKTPVPTWLNAYERRHLTQRLAAYLEETITT